MTVMEAINHIDAIKPNGYSQREKIRWLSVLDGTIKKEIIDKHEGGDKTSFTGYTENTITKTLLVPAPYDDMYIKWLEAQIDYANGEYAKYNNTANAYNAAYTKYAKAYTRDHKPINTAKFKGF